MVAARKKQNQKSVWSVAGSKEDADGDGEVADSPGMNELAER